MPVVVGQERWILASSLFSYMKAADEKKSEEMAKKRSQCWKVSEDGLSYLISFPTWRLGISRKVKKWLKSSPRAGR